jgi:hypothetical protein
LEEFDFEQFAQQLIMEHGSQARAEAAWWAAKMLEHRNYEAYRFWGQAWNAIKTVQNLNGIQI